MRLTPADELALDEIDIEIYTHYMTSYAHVIVETVLTRLGQYGGLLIDLGEGNLWIPPNLYFLALLLARRTPVRQIIFVETAHQPQELVGICSPEELLLGLQAHFPNYADAAARVDLAEPDLATASVTFFSSLREQWTLTGEREEDHRRWLDSTALQALLEERLHRHRIEQRAALTEQEYRTILSHTCPYTPVVNGGRFIRLISRDRVALLIARAVVERVPAL